MTISPKFYEDLRYSVSLQQITIFFLGTNFTFLHPNGPSSVSKYVLYTTFIVVTLLTLINYPDHFCKGSKYPQVPAGDHKQTEEPQWSREECLCLTFGRDRDVLLLACAHLSALCSSTAPSLRSSPLPPRMSCAWLAWKKCGPALASLFPCALKCKV